MSEITSVLSSNVTVTLVRRHVRNTVLAALLVTVTATGGCVPTVGEVPGDEVGSGMDTGSGSGSGSGSGEIQTGAFPVDCAATANQMTPHCARPSLVPAGSIGAGPATPDTGMGTLGGGFVDGNRLIAAFAYSTSNTTIASGYVVAIDLDSGTRTVVSGSYVDPSTGRALTGSGPDWGSVNDVQPGPDGWYAITSLGVYRIDPATGARTLVIDSANTATRCTVGTTKAIPRKDSLAIGPDKAVYLALSNSPAGTGTGLVAVKAGVCKIVALGGGPTGTAVGSGATMTSGYFRSVRFQNNMVWGLEFISKSLMKVDVTNGARTRVSSTGTTRVGAGDPDVGSGWLTFSSTGTVFTSLYDGLNQQAHITEIGATNGDRNEVGLDGGPINKGGATYPSLWLHPTKAWALVGLDNAIVALDIPSGASYTLSR